MEDLVKASRKLIRLIKKLAEKQDKPELS